MSTFLAIDTHGGNDIAPMSQYFEANVYPYLTGKGFTQSSFFGPLAQPGYVGPAAEDPAVSLLVGVGHGTYTSFQGFQQAVFSVGSYSADQVKGKIVHFLSCETAQQLGPAFVRDGCLAYIGYDENFTRELEDAEFQLRLKQHGLDLRPVHSAAGFQNNIVKIRDLAEREGVETLRLEAARVMMEQTSHPIETVAMQTGFADRERMRRAFLRAFGQPPQAIRRSANA